jgi:hypothetical protein
MPLRPRVYLYAPTYNMMKQMCSDFMIPCMNGNAPRWITASTMDTLLLGTYQPIIIICSCEEIPADNMQMLEARQAVILPLICKCIDEPVIDNR